MRSPQTGKKLVGGLQCTHDSGGQSMCVGMLEDQGHQPFALEQVAPGISPDSAMSSTGGRICEQWQRRGRKNGRQSGPAPASAQQCLSTEAPEFCQCCCPPPHLKAGAGSAACRRASLDTRLSKEVNQACTDERQDTSVMACAWVAAVSVCCG